MNLWAVVQSLVILTLANGTPVVAKKVLGARFSRLLDGGMTFFDKRPLFGPSKTARGIVVAILATAAGAPIVGVDPEVGALMTAAAMAGDLFSSFVKRRLDLPPSSQALGLDQVPESLLPLLVGNWALSLTAVEIVEIVVAVVLFFVGELLLARVLYKARFARPAILGLVSTQAVQRDLGWTNDRNGSPAGRSGRHGYNC